ncbi:hypothetical protein TSOC_013099, partial [Tetrabaena socialis]
MVQLPSWKAHSFCSELHWGRMKRQTSVPATEEMGLLMLVGVRRRRLHVRPLVLVPGQAAADEFAGLVAHLRVT